MFLIGGPAFSGKTLLAHLLNQGRIVCLDEPDFHNPHQSHRGIPLLKRLFPEKHFPERADRALTYEEAFDLVRECEAAIRPCNLGMKTAGDVSVEYAKIYREHGYPTIGVVRDIRDVLAEGPLPDWIGGERVLNAEFRRLWRSVGLFDLLVRYEDLVADPESIMRKTSSLLGYDLDVLNEWHAATVHPTMFKLDRHELLRSGAISQSRVGIWRTATRTFGAPIRRTAKMMGY